jgi:uncharacterized C2H2 Zn-finger protein
MEKAPNEQECELKCYSCGKVFKYQSHFNRHKNKKTPCLIREVKPDQIANPNRCIFCNKIFSKKSNLNKHLSVCKIKNGGMDILVDKVKYEQDIRILKEQREVDQQQIKQLREEMDILKKVITSPAAAGTVNNTFNAPININVTINNYTTPSIAGLTITQDELTNVTKLSKFLLEKLYFNPALPENHCIYLKNIKDKSLIVHNNNKWEAVCGENTTDVISKLGNSVYGNGVNLLNGSAGPYNGLDGNFLKLLPANQTKIQSFNTSADTLTNDDAYEVFLGGREAVLETIRASGCSLV